MNAQQPFRLRQMIPASANNMLTGATFLLASLLAGSALAQPLAEGLPPEAGVTEADQEGTIALDTRDPLPIEEVRLFAEALEAIRNAYVNEIDDRTLIDYAVRGMLAGLDPHSAYLSVDDYDTLQESTEGEFGGLGIEIGEEDGYIKIITPLDDSPASRAGVMPGDLIIEINGRPVRDMMINDAIEMLRGEIGTTVDLTLARENVAEPIDLTLTRDAISTVSVRHRMLEPGFAYMRISQFRVNTGSEVVDALRELAEENPDGLEGLVLDLRNNPGGVLIASVETADAFLTEGRVVYTEGRFEETDESFYATEDDPSNSVPLVVLINAGTASAAEIVSGALQDHGRAVIMGTQSFGKGSVQTVMPLNNDRAIKLTTSRYFTPDGRSIQAQGITPDIEIDEGLVTRQTNRRGIYTERDLDGHLPGTDEMEADSETPQAPAPQPITSSEQVVVSDYQLNEALTLLKGWSIMDRGRRRQAQ